MLTAIVVEDEKIISAIIAGCLQKASIVVNQIDNAEAAWEMITKKNYDLAVIDINLPGWDGLQLVEKLRQNKKTSKLPIIIVTQFDEVSDRVKGLNCGADDYLCKPFDNEELSARVKALLRRHDRWNEQALTISYCNWRYNKATRELLLDGRQVFLTAKEYDVFELFLKNPERVFTRAEFEDILWCGVNLESSRFIDQHIKNIKKKIKQINPDYNCIESIWGVGYKFVGKF